jgi:hypothetical protein
VVAETTAVGRDVLSVAPSALMAVTTTRIVWSTSAGVRTYALRIAPAMFAQLAPDGLHRCQR